MKGKTPEVSFLFFVLTCLVPVCLFQLSSMTFCIFNDLNLGRIEFECFSFSFRSVIEPLLRAHELSAKRKGIVFRKWLTEECDYLLIGEPYRLRQVLCNLLYVPVT